MANNEKLIIEERARDIGNFMVGRLLPFRKKRQVGPFTFVDHMGPSLISDPRWMDVDQHPHIGLSTFTYLLEGAVHHKDSTGANQIIHAGDVGMMTAGRGVTHTERTPMEMRTNTSLLLHGYQIWIALPIDKEEMEPRFDYVPSSSVPTWKQDGMTIRLLAGKAFGHESPLPLNSPMYVLDIQADAASELDIKESLFGEIGVLVTTGAVSDQEERVEAGQLLVSKTENECKIHMEEGSRVLIFGGPALTEERFLFWNFVSSSKERLERAKKDWKEGRFPKVPNDTTYIPIPERKR
ncbi:MAG: pirin family protein [Saprospiraceae bacterium]|nr:pirin family protein [Saprospiraceae bacterium]